MRPPFRPSCPSPPLRHRGFTLIEAAITTVIIGIGVVAILQLLAAGTMANAGSANLTSGMNLANNIRELTQNMAFADPDTPAHWGAESGEVLATYDDVDDLDGQTFSPPIDARRQTLSQLSTWSQSVTVQSVDPNLLTLEVPHGTQSPDQRPLSRVTATVSHNGHVVCSTSWLVVYTAQ